MEKLTSQIMLFSLHAPAWLWRVSIKSTAWLWWPLAFLGKPTVAAARPDLYRRLVIATLWGKATIAFAVLSDGKRCAAPTLTG